MAARWKELNGIAENKLPIDVKVHASGALEQLQILKEDLIDFAPATVSSECWSWLE